jgi:hypothetical protein
MSDPIHTIPIPHGWSIEQAWEAIKRGDELPAGRKGWESVTVHDGVVVEVIEGSK